MFTDFRNDDTQNLFNYALKRLNHGYYNGFNGDDVLVISSDYELLETLKKIEQNEINNNATDKKNNVKIEDLNYSIFQLDPNQKLSNYYRNALYFEQGRYLDDYGYGPGEIGGEITLFLSNTPSKLIPFVKPVIEKHLSDFDIDLYQTSLFTDPSEALLMTKLSINNKRVEKLSNSGNYCSRFLLRSAPEDITHAIKVVEQEKEDELING